MKRDRDFDRFDRMERNLERRREQEPARAPVITSERGPRFCGTVQCPVCFFAGVGVIDAGTLSDGRKVGELFTHSSSNARRLNGRPRCAGSGQRLEKLPDGTWRPL
jgi:hypothetical protein